MTEESMGPQEARLRLAIADALIRAVRGMDDPRVPQALERLGQQKAALQAIAGDGQEEEPGTQDTRRGVVVGLRPLGLRAERGI